MKVTVTPSFCSLGLCALIQGNPVLVNGVHGDQRDFPLLAGFRLCGVRCLSCRRVACLSAVLGKDGYACIRYLAAQALAA